MRFWDHVPVFIQEPGNSRPAGYMPAVWDQFFRDYVIPNEEPKEPRLPAYDENGVSIFYPIEINLDPKYQKAIDWHKRQIREGVRNGVSANRGGMKMVPAKGFYVAVRREAYGDATFASRVELRESLAGVTFGKQKPPFDAGLVTYTSRSLGIEEVGSDYNPFPELFAQIVEFMPKAWARWLKERRLKRWKPEPEWLNEIRANKGRGVKH